MSQPATPMKRVLTEETHSAISASRLPYGNFVSDDLAARLQNLGSRVRKSVNEGYATQRFGGIPSVTPTPFSSPVKPSTTTSPQSTHIFRSANDTLLDVFSSPSHSNDAVHPVSPSRRKRRHTEIDREDDDKELSPLVVSETLYGESTAAPRTDPTSEDEDVMIITDDGSKRRRNRPIKPLRLSGRTHHPPDVPSTQPCITKSCFSPSVPSPHTGGATRGASDWKNMFNQTF